MQNLSYSQFRNNFVSLLRLRGLGFHCIIMVTNRKLIQLLTSLAAAYSPHLKPASCVIPTSVVLKQEEPLNSLMLNIIPMQIYLTTEKTK